MRWFQFGTFSPVMRLHGCRAPQHVVINKAGEVREGCGADNEVWSFGEENTPVLVGYIRLREAMRGYLRAVTDAAHTDGDPIMRPLFYDFPADAEGWDIRDEYMFGPDVLVAPVMEPGADVRRVYLPAGAAWTLLHDGTVYAGGAWYDVPAPLAQVPAFLRDGRHAEWIGMV